MKKLILPLQQSWFPWLRLLKVKSPLTPRSWRCGRASPLLLVTPWPDKVFGAGYTAQLFGGPDGTAVGALTALNPSTTFRTSMPRPKAMLMASWSMFPVLLRTPGGYRDEGV
jgi:hypothetical protein